MRKNINYIAVFFALMLIVLLTVYIATPTQELTELDIYSLQQSVDNEDEDVIADFLLYEVEVPAIVDWDEDIIATLLSAREETDKLTSESELLRKFPYPFRAMVCITTDCDDMTIESFLRIHRFLNTFEYTSYGRGLGLDIANSFFMFNASPCRPHQATWFAGTNPNMLRDAEFIQKFWEVGWIDAIHTFGDFSAVPGITFFTRELGLAAWEALEEAGIQPTVWIDHGDESNVQNFGASNFIVSPDSFFAFQQGDDPNSLFYHTDVTLAGSVRFVWHSRHSHQFGSYFPLTARSVRDGQMIWNFYRYTSDIRPNGSIDWTWSPDRLRDQITEARLDELEYRGQYAVIAQHLNFEHVQMGEPDIVALRMLAYRFHETQTILVTRTSRLLAYAVAQRYVVFKYVQKDGYTGIFIVGIDDPTTGFREPLPYELKGLTFYTDNPESTIIFVGDTYLRPCEIQINGSDQTGRLSVSIPWFEQDTFDYAQLWGN